MKRTSLLFPSSERTILPKSKKHSGDYGVIIPNVPLIQIKNEPSENSLPSDDRLLGWLNKTMKVYLINGISYTVYTVCIVYGKYHNIRFFIWHVDFNLYKSEQDQYQIMAHGATLRCVAKCVKLRERPDGEKYLILNFSFVVHVSICGLSARYVCLFGAGFLMVYYFFRM